MNELCNVMEALIKKQSDEVKASNVVDKETLSKVNAIEKEAGLVLNQKRFEQEISSSKERVTLEKDRLALETKKVTNDENRQRFNEKMEMLKFDLEKSKRDQAIIQDEFKNELSEKEYKLHKKQIDYQINESKEKIALEYDKFEHLKEVDKDKLELEYRRLNQDLEVTVRKLTFDEKKLDMEFENSKMRHEEVMKELDIRERELKSGRRRMILGFAGKVIGIGVVSLFSFGTHIIDVRAERNEMLRVPQTNKLADGMIKNIYKIV